ncbi:MAG: ATP-binding protein [Gammaproteobacteria bacterium]|jgi:predicted AAA+ superfamily ATPase
MEFTGIKRNLFSQVTDLLEYFPIVVILGARQTGKTTLSKQIAPNWKYLDLENPRDYDNFTTDPIFVFERYPQKLIIDEAQEYPDLFKILRGVIDANRNQKGRYILTGSSNPELKNHVAETLAGRVATIELGTLKANEYYDKPLSQFYDLFKQKLSKGNIVSGAPPLTQKEINYMWLRGGFPEPIQYNDAQYQTWMQKYFDSYINRDLAKLFPKLNKIAYSRFINILGSLSGSILNKANIGRAVEVHESTIREYLEIAEGTYIFRLLLSYEKSKTKSIVKMPKGYIRDTGLIHYLQKISDNESLYNNQIVGRSFESFVIEELFKGIEAAGISNVNSFYYRTRNGAEIDLILDGYFGVLPIEIKYGSTVLSRQLQTLERFVIENKLPFGMIINQSKQVEWLRPRIIQIPVGWL